MAVETNDEDVTFEVETPFPPEVLEERLCALIHEPDTLLTSILGTPYDGSVDRTGFHLTRNRFRIPGVAFSGRFIPEEDRTRVVITGMTGETAIALRFGPWAIVLPIVICFAAIALWRHPLEKASYLWLLALFIPWWLGAFARWRMMIAFREDRDYLIDLITGGTDGHRRMWWEKKEEGRKRIENDEV
jgi:hypothetical protein